MSLKKLVFLGSKPVGYQCLSYLLEQKAQLGIEVTGLLTRSRKEFGEGNDLTQLAAEHQIPVLKSLAELPECDILYSVQYHEILKQEHISKVSELAVNLHMAPLPEYRGANQFTFAILENKKEFGATIHKIDTRIDHGDILFQDRFAIPEHCWVDDLYQLTLQSSVRLFTTTLANVISGDFIATPQQQLEKERGTSLHYKNEMASLKILDLSWDKERIERTIRATSMPGFEPPYFIMDGKKVYVGV